MPNVQLQSGLQVQRRAGWAVCILATLLLATGCSPENPCGAGVTPPSRSFSTVEVCADAALYEASAAIGYGASQFTAFDEGVVLYVEHGPQGAQHIFGAVSVTGLNPGERAFSEPRGCQGAEVYDPVSVAYTVSFPEDLYPSITNYGAGWLEGGTTQAATSGPIRLVMNIWDVIAAYPDEERITLTAQTVVSDACGTTVEATGAFLLSLDE
ncbi:MAG: hypothetical protein CMP23_01905 [Rickettsiales bacterium]|nr:hypothetical protein [Rickettsiales bacterium]